MGRYSGKTCRLLCMLSLTSSFFLVELIVGYITNSLALVGDSYHMLSDVVALLVGFASVRIAKWSTQKNTFGWARAEVLGALVNAVFLCALCFTIFVEALQRMFGDEHIHDPNLMLIVGGIGLVVNLIGLVLFHGHSHGGHGHSHGGGGHGHSHGGSSESHGDKKKHKKKEKKGEPAGSSVSNGQVGLRLIRDQNVDAAPHQEEDSEEEEDSEPKIVSSAQLNMKGVFLHILGDALGSVIVIISALFIKFVEQDWKYKIDPAMSMLLVVIILSTSIPLLRESALILLQTVPTHIHIKNLQDKLLEKVEGVLAIHEFHVWQLAGNRIIASAHIRCRNLADYMKIAEDVKKFFHHEGIHSTTIQPEFVECGREDCTPLTCCLLQCPPRCQKSQCCRPCVVAETPPDSSVNDAAAELTPLTHVYVDAVNGECPTGERGGTHSASSSPTKAGGLLTHIKDGLARSTHSLSSHLSIASPREAGEQGIRLVEHEQTADIKS